MSDLPYTDDKVELFQNNAPDGLRYLPVKMYLPHEKGMRLIDELSYVSHTMAMSRTLMIEGSNLSKVLQSYKSNGEKSELAVIPSYFVVELVAQSMGAWASYYDILQGKPKVDFGMLLGGRKVKFFKDEISSDVLIETRSNMIFKDNRLGSFEFSVYSRPLSSEQKQELISFATNFYENFDSFSFPKEYKPIDYADALTYAIQRVQLGLGEMASSELLASGRINIFQANEDEIDYIFESTK